MRGSRGLSLVELMVSLTVVLLLMASASVVYLKLLKGYQTQTRIAESHLENLCGLELLRYDIEMAGYGLPWNLNGNSYQEAVAETGTIPDPAVFNDSTTGVPRAFAFSDNGTTAANNSDVLVIRSAIASINQASRKWSVIYGSKGSRRIRQWQNPASPSLDFQTGERFICLLQTRTLLPNSGTWSFAFNTGFWNDANAIDNSSDLGLVYGIANPDSNPLRMPFNRVDYHLAKPSTVTDFPSRCAPTSFILYRSTIINKIDQNDGGGRRDKQPLLDCVMDFQVGFGLDTDGDGAVDSWMSDLAMAAGEIREQLREVRVFVLFHEGRCDENYLEAGSLTLGDADTGPLKVFTPSQPPSGTATNCNFEAHYRWKVAKLAVKPMNLQPRQWP